MNGIGWNEPIRKTSASAKLDKLRKENRQLLTDRDALVRWARACIALGGRKKVEDMTLQEATGSAWQALSEELREEIADA